MEHTIKIGIIPIKEGGRTHMSHFDITNHKRGYAYPHSI